MTPNEPGLQGDSTRDYLHSLVLHGIKLGLQNTQHLLKELGNPQDQFPSVHIAGTNGKGSTNAFLATILRTAGYKTGQFTSPHLIDMSERFLINGIPIPNDELTAIVQDIQNIAEQMAPKPTFFEACTAIAFTYFARQNVDIAIIETGMGGRLDSTNILHPIATAITNISLDHTEFLGDTLSAIATEKAGIIKPNTPLILSESPDEALETITAITQRQKAPVLHTTGTYTNTSDKLQNHFSWQEAPAIPLGLHGAYQAQNAATAACIAQSIQTQFPNITPGIIQQGLEHTRWPCRMQQVMDTPPVFIDVAHNKDGASQIAKLDQQWTIVLAVSSNKDGRGILESLAPYAQHLILTQFQGSRALPLPELAQLAQDIPHTTQSDIPQAIEHGLTLSTPEAPLLIVGSLYTAGEAHAYLQAHHNIAPLTF